MLIIDDNRKRVGWHQGVVEELFSGKESRVRVVALRLATGTISKRATKTLYPLELRAPLEEDDFCLLKRISASSNPQGKSCSASDQINDAEQMEERIKEVFPTF